MVNGVSLLYQLGKGIFLCLDETLVQLFGLLLGATVLFVQHFNALVHEFKCKFDQCRIVILKEVSRERVL